MTPKRRSFPRHFDSVRDLSEVEGKRESMDPRFHGDDRRSKRVFFYLLGGFMLFFLSSASLASAASFRLQSPAFKNGDMIPENFTCDGKNESPALTWTGAPEGTQSFMLIMEDPDAPLGNWVHWIVYNLPPVIQDMPGGFPAIETLANSEMHGTNSFHKLGYGGPCPPSGTHRYYFRLYALNQMFNIKPGLRKKELFKIVQSHILAKAELMGRYKHRSVKS